VALATVPDVTGTERRVRARLVVPMPGDRLWGWLFPLLVTGLAAFLRFYRLGVPRGLVFDEVYYVHDAYSLSRAGVELNNGMTGPGFVVHPPLGKWMIAFGEWIFSGPHTIVIKHTIYPAGTFGWRFSAALVGTLSVLILARTARRMFRSTLLGTVAGLLLALDGLEFVQSRTAMLDIFLMFWVLAGFACLVVDRDDGRRRLAARRTESRFGPFLGVRWWRVAAGVCAGAACATKWSGWPYVLAFLLLAFVWDVGARRTAGVDRPVSGTLLKDGLPSLVPLGLLPVILYPLSYLGWFLGDANTAYDHDLYVHPHQGWLGHFFAVFHGWLKYQTQIWHFHVTLSASHPYKSYPLSWLVLARPVAYFYTSPHSCGAGIHSCSKEVLDIGTPAIWWASILALIWLLWRLVSRRDWRAWGILIGFAAGYLVWFVFPDRTMFLFYALAFVPFLCLALTYCLGDILGPQRRPVGAWPVVRTVVAGLYLVVVTVNFFFMYPVLSAQTIPYSQWQARIWFASCSNGDQYHENAPCWI
jgi:dolichyl-phosphate-mannose-protein mannosyltransferase